MNPAQVPVFSSMANVLDVVRQCIQNRSQRLVTDEDKKAVAKWLLSTLTTTRLFLFRDKTQFATAWKEIRTHESIVDFVMGLTNDIRIALAFSEVSFEELSAQFARTTGQFHASPDNLSAMDHDLLERLPNEKEIKDLYTVNPWFVTLLLIDHLGWESSVILERAAPGLTTGANRR